MQRLAFRHRGLQMLANDFVRSTQPRSHSRQNRHRNQAKESARSRQPRLQATLFQGERVGCRRASHPYQHRLYQLFICIVHRPSESDDERSCRSSNCHPVRRRCSKPVREEENVRMSRVIDLTDGSENQREGNLRSGLN